MTLGVLTKKVLKKQIFKCWWWRKSPVLSTVQFVTLMTGRLKLTDTWQLVEWSTSVSCVSSSHQLFVVYSVIRISGDTDIAAWCALLCFMKNDIVRPCGMIKVIKIKKKKMKVKKKVKNKFIYIGLYTFIISIYISLYFS